MTASPARRRFLWGGVGAAAGAAGLAGYWLHGPSDDLPDASLWALAYERPDGGQLRLGEFRGRPWILNFWATWCPPCLRELPEFERFHRERHPAGWQVVGLAIDRLDSVREFLARHPLSFPIGLAGYGGTELCRQLGNPSGALPFTVVFGVDGSIRHRKLGETRRADIDRWVQAA